MTTYYAHAPNLSVVAEFLRRGTKLKKYEAFGRGQENLGWIFEFCSVDDFQAYLEKMGPACMSWIEHADGRFEVLWSDRYSAVELSKMSKLWKYERGAAYYLNAELIIHAEDGEMRIAKLESLTNLTIERNSDNSYNIESLALAMVANRERLIAEVQKILDGSAQFPEERESDPDE